jgi:hypothetical protein
MSSDFSDLTVVCRAGCRQSASEVEAGELAALIGVENLGLAMPRQRFLDRLDQNAASRVIDTRCASTRRPATSTTAARYTKPRRIGMYG